MSYALENDPTPDAGPSSCKDIARKLDPLFAEPDPVPETTIDAAQATDLVPGQEHMKVYQRIRPFTDEEKEKQEDQVRGFLNV